MSDNRKRISHWKLMLVGTFSVTIRRVLVISLTGLSLIVWTVTVIGMGVLRGNSGAGGVPQAVSASVVLSPGAVVLPEVPDPEPSQPADEDVVAPVVETAALTIRDPFMPSEAHFPPIGGAPGSQSGNPMEGRVDPDLKAADVSQLKLEATMLLGNETVGVVVGNVMDLGGRRLVLMTTRAGGSDGAGEKAIAAKDARANFKVGEEIEARPLTPVTGGYVVGSADEAVVIRVKTIAMKDLVLARGDETCKLEMSK